MVLSSTLYSFIHLSHWFIYGNVVHISIKYRFLIQVSNRWVPLGCYTSWFARTNLGGPPRLAVYKSSPTLFLLISRVFTYDLCIITTAPLATTLVTKESLLLFNNTVITRWFHAMALRPSFINRVVWIPDFLTLPTVGLYSTVSLLLRLFPMAL